MLDRYREWKRRREEASGARWAKIRQKGKSYFVSGFALKWGIGMTVNFAVVKYLFGEQFHLANLTIILVMGFLLGLVLGLTNWSSQEREYFKQHPAAEAIYNITGRDI